MRRRLYRWFGWLDGVLFYVWGFFGGGFLCWGLVSCFGVFFFFFFFFFSFFFFFLVGFFDPIGADECEKYMTLVRIVRSPLQQNTPGTCA